MSKTYMDRWNICFKKQILIKKHWFEKCLQMLLNIHKCRMLKELYINFCPSKSKKRTK